MKPRILARLAALAALKAADTPKPVESAPKKPERPAPPTRPFDAPSAPQFIRLDGKPGGAPPADANGSFLVAPEYVPAAETKTVEGVPQGKVQQFVMNSTDCVRFNPGIPRKKLGPVDPQNPKTLIVATHTIDYKRTITVYIPAQYVPSSAGPVRVTHHGPGFDKPDMNLPRTLDNLIAQKRIPPVITAMIANGGGDAKGHERGKEYETMSGLFAEFIQLEVLQPVGEPIGTGVRR